MHINVKYGIAKKKKRKRKTTYKCPSLCNKLPLEIKRSGNLNKYSETL